MSTQLYEELAWRGLVNQTTFDNPEAINEPRTFYFGADPSSDSMTIGNLAGVVLVKRLVDAAATNGSNQKTIYFLAKL